MSRAGTGVGISGIGVAAGEGRLSHAELLFRASRAALDEAGLEREDVSSAVTSSYDYVEGRVLSNQFTLDSIGGTMKSCDLRLGDTALHALAAGVAEALSDPGGTVVVASVLLDATDRAPDTGRAIEEVCYEPLFMRPIVAGARHPEAIMFGLMATAYLDRHGVAEDELAELVGRESARGAANPRTPRAILDSDPVAGPIRAGHIAPAADVAVALVLSTRPAGRRRATIRGVGWSAVPGLPDRRDLASQEATRQAAGRAFGEPLDPGGVARVEVTGAYGIDEVLAVEALGLAEPGRGVEALAGDGPPRVNPTGGVQGAGWARGTSGLSTLATAIRELDDAGAGGDLLVGQTWGGFAGSTAAVVVVEVGA